MSMFTEDCAEDIALFLSIVPEDRLEITKRMQFRNNPEMTFWYQNACGECIIGSLLKPWLVYPDDHKYFPGKTNKAPTKDFALEILDQHVPDDWNSDQRIAAGRGMVMLIHLNDSGNLQENNIVREVLLDSHR